MTLKMTLASLVSGGKDSLYAMHLAMKDGYDIKYIVNIISENPDSYMFHVPNARLVLKQAELMGIPVIQKITLGEKEKELDDLREVLHSISNEIKGITTGAVQSNYQKDRIAKICDELHLKCINPLWHKDPEKFISDMIDAGFDIIITSVAAPPMDESWLGRKLDKETLKELILLNKKYGISVNGEGGEYESLVLNCPMFSRGLKIKKLKKKWFSETKHGVLELEVE